MFLVLVGFLATAQYVFGASIFLLTLALLFSLYEITISTRTIQIKPEDIEQSLQKHR